MKAQQNRYLLANQIAEVVVALKLKSGHHLTEQFLAKELQVSRTPVRAALGLLEDQGVVVSKPNQGYFLVRPWSDIGGFAIEVPTTPEQELHASIISDRLTGNIPEKITQKELERRYGTNRNTLLRTLSRLADEGLVDRSRGRGWRFMPTLEGRKALRDSYNFRIAVEPTSFGIATFAVDATALKRSQAKHEFLLSGKNLRDVSPTDLFELDADFHEMIAQFSNNSFLLNGVQQQNRLRRMLEFHFYSNTQRVREWLREHLAVAVAIADGELASAARLLTEHLSRAARSAI